MNRMYTWTFLEYIAYKEVIHACTYMEIKGKLQQSVLGSSGDRIGTEVLRLGSRHLPRTELSPRC